MVSTALMWVRYAVAAVGFFLAFYRLLGTPTNMTGALNVVLVVAAVIGLESWGGHVVFHREDAKRLGWEAGNPNFQFEVGFANLAFGLVALIVLLGGWGLNAAAAVLLGYGLYLLQAACLHAYRLLTHGSGAGIRVPNVILSFLLALYLVFFAAAALTP